MERVFRRNGDKELVRQCLGPLEGFHEWYWLERDVTSLGLVAAGAYSGVIQHARYETFDNECNLDGLNLTVHPTRPGEKEGGWSLWMSATKTSPCASNARRNAGSLP